MHACMYIMHTLFTYIGTHIHRHVHTCMWMHPYSILTHMQIHVYTHRHEYMEVHPTHKIPVILMDHPQDLLVINLHLFYYIKHFIKILVATTMRTNSL